MHRRAIVLMVLAATLWSTAGVVTRHLSPDLQSQGRFEITFWRSLFAGLTVAAYLLFIKREGMRPVLAAGRAGLLSGLCWATMYCAFMLALTLTTVANTLIVMSVGPLLTALLARAVLRTPIAARTWISIAAAMIGMAAMVAHGAAQPAGSTNLLGLAIAFAVPVAAAINLVTLQKTRAHVDLVPAVFLGGAISAVAVLPFAVPFQASAHDVLLLAALGVFQLGVPCTLMVMAARSLSATEISLLALLEVVLGPLWAWLGAGETPAAVTLAGGAVVLGALVFNELAPRQRRAAIATGGSAGSR